MATEVEFAGNRYQLGRLDAMTQFHVSRRIAPVLPPLIRTYMELAASDSPLTKNLGLLATSVQPVMDAISQLKDDDAEYVVGKCMAVVERQHMAGWAKVWSPVHKVSLFDDIDVGVMLELTVRVVMENLGPFISGLLTSLASNPDVATQAG
jgi:hypothetical protein